MVAPPMVRERATVEPVLPVVAGPAELMPCNLQRRRRSVFAPRQRDEPVLALLEQTACGGRRAFEPNVEVGREAQPRSVAFRNRLAGYIRRGLGDLLVITVAGVRPVGRHPAVVERGSAVHID